MPAVSVVIPAYNRAAFLGEAIESVRRQTFQDWELVVVNDGSTDRIGEVVARYRDDPRIRYVSQPHQERSAARNRGIEASSGPYVALLDADDCWMPDKLVKQVAAMAKHPEAGLCYTLTRRMDAAGTCLDPPRQAADAVPEPLSLGGWGTPSGSGRSATSTNRFLARLLRHNCVGTSSVLLRRRCLERVGLFDTNLPAFGREDWDVWLRIARWYAILTIPEELSCYRVYTGNSSQEENFRSGLAVLDKCCRDRDFLKEAGMGRTSAYAYLYLASAAAPSTDIRRGTRAKRLLWAGVHHPPCLGSWMALIACARLLFPARIVKSVRDGYRKRFPAVVDLPLAKQGAAR